MKKTITILAAMMMVFSFAGMASALDAVNCAGDGKYIDALGCDTPGEQEERGCGPFDFENKSDYCGQKQANRAVFPICDCIPDPFDNVVVDEEYGIGMKILVDKHDGNGPVEGDNFVYWSNGFPSDGISIMTFGSEGAACSTDIEKNYDATPISTGTFGSSVNDFCFMTANASTCDGGLQDCASPVDDSSRVVEFKLKSDAPGYVVTIGDDDFTASNWVVDIPPMWVDFNGGAQKGWTVYVEVCFNQIGAGSGICHDCICCFDLEIGTLCCDEAPVTSQCTLTFPYFPMTSSYWYGMAVTNTSPDDGTAAVALYENDGDTATGTITIPAHSTKVIMTSDLTATGTLGDAQAYVVVTTDFSDASGFAMMAKENNGVSMGYLAEKCGCGCED